MRLFRLYGEGARHLTRGAAMAYKICRRRMNCSTEEDPVAQYRLEKLRRFEAARDEGNDVKSSLRITGAPKSTLYQWRKGYSRFGEAGLANGSRARKTPRRRRVRTPEAVRFVEALRRTTTWGKALIAEALRRQGIETGETSAGKIINDLLRSGRIERGNTGKLHKAGKRFKRAWAQWRRRAAQAGLSADRSHESGGGERLSLRGVCGARLAWQCGLRDGGGGCARAEPGCG